ncbi:MAG TPA: hypothetical protein P5205_13185 [Candidatus Paceibacterota bacterium]|nr:hypothetical protein [Verrucomicrobiota bacterium]HSA11315.1 hypothetical protein [Candidatus Paceibacterota bacterium]
MKSAILPSTVLIGLLAIQAAPLNAEESQTLANYKTFGAGLMLGEPTGVSLKYWLSDASAVDAMAGLSYDDNDLSFHTDYLYHLDDLVQLDKNRLAFYGGGGPRYRARSHKNDLFGTRAAGGVAYIFGKVPMDIFLEVGPVLDLTPDAKVRYTAGIGARYWF